MHSRTLRTTRLSGLLAAAALTATAVTGCATTSHPTTTPTHTSAVTVTAEVAAPAAFITGRGSLHTHARSHAADRARTFHGTVKEALATLKVASEYTTGYDRDNYNHWISQGNGCDTRDVVLITENKDPLGDPGPDCTYTGRWYSYYDKTYTTDPSTFDIDHLTPLGEADPSGAYRWTSGTKERYANDLGDPRALVAVTASSNRSKSDQDPAEWEPDFGKCRYISEWVAIKVRWHLSVDRAEKRAIAARINACPTKTITVTKARIYRTTTPDPGTGGGGGGTATGLRIAAITYDPPGADDNANLNNETITLINPTGNSIACPGGRSPTPPPPTTPCPPVHLPPGSR